MKHAIGRKDMNKSKQAHKINDTRHKHINEEWYLSPYNTKVNPIKDFMMKQLKTKATGIVNQTRYEDDRPTTSMQELDEQAVLRAMTISS